MWTFVVDEDMARSTTTALIQTGYLAVDVRDVGLRGHSDDEIFVYAQSIGAIIVTADKDFTNTQRFPLGRHCGIVVLRIPNELSTQGVNQELVRALADLDGEDLNGLLVIVEVGRSRIRRPIR